MVSRPWHFLVEPRRLLHSWFTPYPPQSGKRRWIGPLVLTVCITILHFSFAPQHMFWHDLLRRAYYLPIIWAIHQSGLRGGALASTAIGAIFTVHLLLGWGQHLGGQMDQVYDIAGYLAVGFGVGFVVDRARAVAVSIAQQEWDISLRGVISAAIHELKKPKAEVRMLAGQLVEHSQHGMWEYSIGMRLTRATDRIDDVRRDLAGIARILSTQSPLTKPFDWAIKFANAPRLGGRFGLMVARIDAASPPPALWPISPAVLDEVTRCVFENLSAETGTGGMADLVVGGSDYCFVVECSCQNSPGTADRETMKTFNGDGNRVRRKLMELIWSRYNGVLQDFTDGTHRGARLLLFKPRMRMDTRDRLLRRVDKESSRRWSERAGISTQPSMRIL